MTFLHKPTSLEACIRALSAKKYEKCFLNKMALDEANSKTQKDYYDYLS